VSNYRASVRVDDDTLHTSRPLTAPEQVSDLVESVMWAVRESGGRLTSVELEFATSDESDTPLADSVSGTSSTPLAPAGAAAPAGVSSGDADEDDA
jgi:hypothetical protein